MVEAVWGAGNVGPMQAGGNGQQKWWQHSSQKTNLLFAFLFKANAYLIKGKHCLK